MTKQVKKAGKALASAIDPATTLLTGAKKGYDKIKDAASRAQAAAVTAGEKEAVMPTPDDEAARLAKRRQAARMRKGSGRISTILADATLG